VQKLAHRRADDEIKPFRILRFVHSRPGLDGSAGDAAVTLPSSYSEPLGGRLPNEAETRNANQLRQILAAQMAAGDGEVRLQILDGNEVVLIALHRSLSELFMEVLRFVGAGDAVTLVPVHQRLTTQQAADVLNVSRPYLVKLLEQGEMPFETVGRHRRIKAADVFAYGDRRATERSAGLGELAHSDADLI